jgi:hypothetical protein
MEKGGGGRARHRSPVRVGGGQPFWSLMAMDMAILAFPKDQMLRLLKCQRIFNAF